MMIEAESDDGSSSADGQQYRAYVLSSDQPETTQLGNVDLRNRRSAKSGQYRHTSVKKKLEQIEQIREQARIQNMQNRRQHLQLIQEESIEEVKRRRQTPTSTMMFSGASKRVAHDNGSSSEDNIDHQYRYKIKKKVRNTARAVAPLSSSSSLSYAPKQNNGGASSVRHGIYPGLDDQYQSLSHRQPKHQTNKSRRWRRYPNFQQETTSRTQPSSRLFEPQYIKAKPPQSYNSADVNWQYKATKEGFLYFYIPGTNTFQWNFPVVFDPISGRKKTLFVDNWVKKYDLTGRKFYRDSDTGQTQDVKPDSETYLIQAAILGNICFLNLYLRAKGSLAISDKRGRTALHHCVANGHRTMTKMLCEFGAFENLLERPDKTGSTPLFNAVKHSQTETLQVLIQYSCNVFHRNAKGDTCLHEAATYDSQKVLPILVSFVTEELFEVRNRDYMTAADIAASVQNTSFLRSLEVIKRNITVQHALADRDATHGRPQHYPSRHSRSSRFNDENSSSERSSQQRFQTHNIKSQRYTHQERLIQETERMAAASRPSTSQNRPSRIRKQQSRTHREEDQVLQREPKYSDWHRQKVIKEKAASKSARNPTIYHDDGNDDQSFVEVADNLHHGQISVEHHLPADLVGDQQQLHISSSRIHESYFDDEMQARVTRSAQQRARRQHLSQRSTTTTADHHQRSNSLLEQNLGSAVSQTSRVISRVGTFFAQKYQSLMDYLYDRAPPRYNGGHRNRVMQAPPDDSMMGQRSRSSVVRATPSQLGDLTDESSSAPDKSLNSAMNEYERSDIDGASYGSEGYKTAWSRSRSVRRPQSRSRMSRSRPRQHHQEPMMYEQPQLQNVNQEMLFRDQGSPPRLMTSTAARSTSRQVRFPQEIVEVPESSAQVHESEQESRVETKNISVQVYPLPGPKTRKKKKRGTTRAAAADLSKRSIGVGSLCIDETIVEVSRIQQTTLMSINSGSTLARVRHPADATTIRSKVRNFSTQKRYLSSEDEKPSAKVSAQVAVPKPQQLQVEPLVTQQTLERAQDGFIKDTITSEIKNVVPQEKISVKPPQAQQPRSKSLAATYQAPSQLTQEQVDIVNLNGGASSHRSQPHSEYRLEQHHQSTAKEKLKTFYAKLAEHEKLDEASSKSSEANKSDDKSVISKFNPEDQDEENYQFQNSNQQFFDYSVVEANILGDLKQELLDEISECSFIPRYDNTASKRGPATMSRNASQASLNQLDKGQFVQGAGVSILSTNQSQSRQSKQQPALTTACLTPLMAYQSDSDAPKRRIRLPKLPNAGNSKQVNILPPELQQKLPKQAAITNQVSESEKVIEKREDQSTAREQLLMELFSNEKESARLTTQQQDPVTETHEIEGKGDKTTLTEPPSELFFKGNDTIANEKEELQQQQLLKKTVSVTQTMMQHTVSSGTTKSKNQRYGNGGEQASSMMQDLTLLNFELSKDVSTSHLQMMMGQGTTMAQNTSTGDGPLQPNDCETTTGIFPPQNLKQPEDDIQVACRTTNNKTKSDKAMPPNILDELESISQIKVDPSDLLSEEDNRLEKRASIIPPVQLSSPSQKREGLPGRQRGDTQTFEFYGQQQQKMMMHDSEEAEVVFHNPAVPETDDDFGEQSHRLKKQNYSTMVAVKNHFLSSASEDEDEAQTKKRQNAARRTKIKGVALAAMHSSVNNGARDSGLPLYGQRRGAPVKKSINEITYKHGSDSEPAQAAQQATAGTTTQASSSQKSMSVSERFKASLKAFKTNKLIKNNGAGSVYSANSSKLSLAAGLSQKSPTRHKQ